MEQSQERVRVAIEGVKPEINCGRFPVKRISGDTFTVEADIFSDGHDALSARLLYRKKSDTVWNEIPMQYLVNDRWRASFIVNEVGTYYYTVTAWVDHFKSWQNDLTKRIKAEQQEDIDLNLLIGAELVTEAAGRAGSPHNKQLSDLAEKLKSSAVNRRQKFQTALSKELSTLMESYTARRFAVTYPKELVLWIERERARFSAWYEMFPRSASNRPGVHGTFKDCEERLPYIEEMGFNVLYLPPIHPIGLTNRKGKNNSVVARDGDPGTPWAIGAKEGGHKAVHPELGTINDFCNLVKKAKEHGIEIALDIAFQCSPDHPYVKEHPQWFRLRPDGTIQYAENPPKKYQDIYPLTFESDDWRGLWQELKSIILFWIDQGIRIFRVDNPHTKPFQFWEWLIAEVKNLYPEVIFLAEAFTRPKVMYHLAKLGFTQSYTYYTWRNTDYELTTYLAELTNTEVSEYFRPNLWPNTPDILTEYLQTGGKPAFIARLVLAATLGASYGIYGAAYELCENRPKEPGSEEYLDSEKYEIKSWDISHPDSLKNFIALINNIRCENPALQRNDSLKFYPVDNDRLICYSKNTEDYSNVVLVCVNLDPIHRQSGWVELPLESLELEENQQYQVHDLLSGSRYLWYGSRNYLDLDPKTVPAHIFSIRRRIRTERDFDYYL
ncbi:alpha-1,4-glucan--maltose-1-phosphate maltosyltransferase [Chloroflexota bacterium]